MQLSLEQSAMSEINFGSSATFFTPPLSNSVMMDLEEVHLTMAEYQYGQQDAAAKLVSEDSTPLKLVKDWGNTNTIKAAWDATADIDFSLTLSGFLYFKIVYMHIIIEEMHLSN